MSEHSLVKLSLCVEVDCKEEVESVENWIRKWKHSFKFFEESGCGSCVLLYEVLAPIKSEKELIENVVAVSELVNSEEEIQDGKC